MANRKEKGSDSAKGSASSVSAGAGEARADPEAVPQRRNRTSSGSCLYEIVIDSRSSLFGRKRFRAISCSFGCSGSLAAYASSEPAVIAKVKKKLLRRHRQSSLAGSEPAFIIRSKSDYFAG